MNNEEIMPLEKETEEEKETKIDEFLTALPDWDLLPPYNVIRKGNDS